MQVIDVYGKMQKILIPQNSQILINSLKQILGPFWTLSNAMNTSLLQHTMLADLPKPKCWEGKQKTLLWKLKLSNILILNE